MKKFTVKFLLLAFMIINISPLFSVNTNAQETYILDVNGIDFQGLEYTLDEETLIAEVTGPAEKNVFALTNVVIPDYVTKDAVTYEVTRIGNSAFSSLEVITSITIPETITVIGANAFDGCEGITSLTIPEGVETIEEYAFSWCAALTTITISSTVTSIENGAFSFCVGLMTISVNNSNTEYSSDASGVLFDKDKNVLLQYPIGNTNDAYAIPSTVTGIESYAFSWCVALKNITIPSTVENIGKSAFSCCANLTSVTMNAGVLIIEESAFECCAKLVSVVLPAGVVSIGASIFEDCTSLASISFPDSLRSIGRNAFKNTIWYSNQTDGILYTGTVVYEYKGNMPVNTEIVLDSKTTGIADYAFFSFENLLKITIPAGVESIGYGTFFYCEGLIEIIVASENAKYTSDVNGVLYDKNKTMLIQYPNGSGNESLTIPAGVTSISERAFYYCPGLKSISFPNSVTIIGESAFEGCIGLVNLNFPSNLSTIGDYAFYYCTGLKSAIIPKSVTFIGEDAFYDCAALVLSVYANSFAHEYAINYKLTYKLLTEYTISFSNGYANGIIDKQTVNNIVGKLSTAIVKNSSGVIITGETLVGTGATITYNGNTYTVVVKGDISGDGKVDAKDYLLSKRAYLGTYILSAAKLKAACMEGTTLPTARDYLKIKRHFLGTFNLYV